MDTKAAFEKAWQERYGYELRWEAALSGYRYKNENAAWWAWQESLAAILTDISTENVEALVTTCQHLIEREGYSEHSANLRLIAKLALPTLTSHGIRIKGKTE